MLGPKYTLWLADTVDELLREEELVGLGLQVVDGAELVEEGSGVADGGRLGQREVAVPS